ncbi:hypothetical protein [Macrococcus armenti]|uniref:hypothetical protein n=1 Tax=Macrococcus armenti TaxID=2875764 RepID=UPI001CCF9C79|nr:hypothetical protein [Macrococcus armenti]UBH09207.1 hypothetical protein LAU41_03290 [Macrococcus armenti]UBH11503.1 hypothetical protein LAU38_03285 [Macrococcus armenti]
MRYENTKNKIDELSLPPRIKIELLDALNKDAQEHIAGIKYEDVSKQAEKEQQEEQQEEQKRIDEVVNSNDDLMNMIEENNIRKL